MTTSFGMLMASSENTRDQWNNPLVSGSATSHAAFSGLLYIAPTLQRYQQIPKLQTKQHKNEDNKQKKGI